MSTAPGHPLLRARCAEALRELIEERGARALGRLLGHAGPTITDRGGDLSRWSFDEICALLSHSPTLQTEVLRCIQGTEPPPIGDAVAATSTVIDAVTQAGAMIQAFGKTLADGRVKPDEAKRLLAELMAKREFEDRELLPNLRAVALVTKS